MRVRNSPLKGLISKQLPEVKIIAKKTKRPNYINYAIMDQQARQNKCKKCKGKPKCVCKK